MPLDSDDREFLVDHRLHGSVHVPCDGDETRGEGFHRLVVETVHGKRPRKGQKAVGYRGQMVPGDNVPVVGSDVLVDRSSEEDVDRLHSPADSEKRQAVLPCVLDNCLIQSVRFRIHILRETFILFLKTDRIDVSAPGNEEGGAEVEEGCGMEGEGEGDKTEGFEDVQIAPADIVPCFAFKNYGSCRDSDDFHAVTP